MGILRRAWNIFRSRYLSDSPKEREESDKDVDELYNEMSQKLEKGADKIKKKIKCFLWSDDIKKCFAKLRMEPTEDLVKIRKQWLELMNKFHPDKNPTRVKWATDMSADIDAAYTQIKNFLGKKKKK